ncbi:MAG: hypothetical protein DHS20C17_08500 [Cyclobacteriaceae bacterium]|nr:MAG: hypothetical protein DHS20C17_08500 [Cyclobacteriaceae bacterium]
MVPEKTETAIQDKNSKSPFFIEKRFLIDPYIRSESKTRIKFCYFKAIILAKTRTNGTYEILSTISPWS